MISDTIDLDEDAGGDGVPSSDRLWIPILRIKPRKTLRDWLLAPITIPLAVVVFGAYVLFCARFVIPFFLVRDSLRRQRERQREAHFREQGRLVTWEVLEEKLACGEGILVIQERGGYWWIPEEPSRVVPSLWRPTIPEGNGCYLLPDAVSHAVFCDRYLAFDHGIAHYVAPAVEDDTHPWRGDYALLHVQTHFPRAAILMLLDREAPTTRES